MTATITKTRISDKPMASFFAKRRGEHIEMVDAWIVNGSTAQRPYEIETRDEDRAHAYAAAIDAGDDDLIERMLSA